LISVVYFIVGAYGSNSGMLAPIQDIWLQFLVNRTNHKLRLWYSVASVCRRL